MTTTLNSVRLFLIAAWLGAAIFFSLAVAPATFAVLRSFVTPNAGDIAGAIVNRTLAIVNITGFGISIISMALGLGLRKRYGLRSFVIQNMLLGVVALSTGIGQWLIRPRMRMLRQAMGGSIDLAPLSNPNRVAFAALHGYSVAVLSIAIIAGLTVFFIINTQNEAGRG